MTQTAAAMRAELQALAGAGTREQLDALYVQFVGYSIVADDTAITDDELYLLLSEYIEEVERWGAVPLSFRVDGGEPCGLQEFVTANADDEAVCEWARSARPGDTFPALVSCQCVAP